MYKPEHNSKTLFDLNFNSETRITVEKHQTKGKEVVSAAKEEFYNQSIIEVYVTNLCGGPDSLSLSVKIEREATLKELKLKILEEIQEDLLENEVHLARYCFVSSFQ